MLSVKAFILIKWTPGQSWPNSLRFLRRYFHFFNCSSLASPSFSRLLGCQMSFVQGVLIVGTAVVFHSKSCQVEVNTGQFVWHSSARHAICATDLRWKSRMWPCELLIKVFYFLAMLALAHCLSLSLARFFNKALSRVLRYAIAYLVSNKI